MFYFFCYDREPHEKPVPTFHLSRPIIFFCSKLSALWTEVYRIESDFLPLPFRFIHIPAQDHTSPNFSSPWAAKRSWFQQGRRRFPVNIVLDLLGLYIGAHQSRAKLSTVTAQHRGHYNSSSSLNPFRSRATLIFLRFRGQVHASSHAMALMRW